jgi:Mg2+ and Co2+ transporter CorA
VTAAGCIEGRLHNARGKDRPIDLFRDPPVRLRDRQLPWVDVAGRDPAVLRAIAEPLGLAPSTVEALEQAWDRPLVRRHDDYIHAGFRSAEAAPDGSLEIVPLDLVAAPNIVLTVRNGPVAAFDRFRDEIDGMTQVGRLDTASFTSALVDAILNGYLRLVEDLERRIDELDDAALHARRPTGILEELTALRGRIASLRRALAPHRQAFAALARPDVALHEALGRPWPGLLDRLDTTLGAIETARVLLLGTHDLLMTRVAQRTDETVKILTVVSVALMPAALISSVLGMNFSLPFFEDATNFWVSLGFMAALIAGTVAVAVFRDRS